MTGKSLRVTLDDDLSEALDKAVASGEFVSAEAAVVTALERWREDRMIEAIGVEELRRLVDEGIASGPGRNLSIEEIKAIARHEWEAGPR